MPLSRESLSSLLDRTYKTYVTLYKPAERTPRYNLLKVLASVDAGLVHQMLGDIQFLSKQIFPDSAEGNYLRRHWSDRVPPLFGSAAVGYVTMTGIAGAAIPAGLVLSSPTGKRYYTDRRHVIDTNGAAQVWLRSFDTGEDTNIALNTELTVASSIPPGINSTATAANGISGGSNPETDEEYLTRVIEYLQNPNRYGKPGDFADWAMDATSEVTQAWEYKNFGVFGALLIMVINGNQISGVYPVGNLEDVIAYISENSPPMLFTVRTPGIVPINPEIILSPLEDTVQNRELIESRIKTYMQLTAKPGATFTSGMLRDSFIDGITITAATVKIAGDTQGVFKTTVLQYPVLGVITWTSL